MSPVHLYNPLSNSCGGSEWHTLSLFEILADHGPVDIWTDSPPDKDLFGKFPIQRVDLQRRLIPRGGTFVLLGAYFGAPAWLPFGKYERVVLVYNIRNLEHLNYTVPRLKQLGVGKIEALSVSKELAKELGDYEVEYSGVEYSWIDLERFRPPELKPDRPFTVGRLSRDTLQKYEPTDPDLFLKLADMGFKLRIMGGMCLREALGSHPNIELLPEGFEPPETFLHSIDVFLYRTGAEWFEAFGRVIAEAMASAIIPVAYNLGGYTEIVDHGINGVLYNTNEEAIDWIVRLKDEPDCYRDMAKRARSSMERLFGERARMELVDFYFHGKGPIGL